MPDRELARESARRFERPAFRDGWTLGTLWAAENALVRLLGDAGQRKPEGEHIARAFWHVHQALDLLNKRVGSRRDG